MKPTASFLLATMLAAQTPPQQQTAAVMNANPTFRISTQLVAVDLVATDSSGRPIPNLEAKDLRVQEDGVDRPIKDLHLERAGGKSPQAEEFDKQVKAILAKLPKDVATNLTAMESMPTSTASTVLVLDALNTEWTARTNARQQMLKLLKTLDPKQPIAVYGLSGSLHLLQDFTSDPESLRKAIDAAGKQGAALGGVQGDLIDHSMSDSMAEMLSESRLQEMRAFEFESSARQEDIRVQRTISAFTQIARRLENLPGRKNLMWLSSSFPINLMPDEFGDPAKQQRRDYDQQLLMLAAALEDARVSVYPVSADGLQTQSVFSPDRRMSAPQIFYGGRGFGTEIQQQSTQDMARRDTMNLIAERTGGRAFYNRNDLGNAVGLAIQDGGTYFALAFTPKDTQADGKFHTIKVTSARKGVVLRYRHGYYALDPGMPSKERSKQIEQEIYDALVEQSQLSTGVVLLAKRKPNQDAVEVVVHGQSLTFAEADNGSYRAQFELATATFDEKGKVLTSQAQTVSANIGAEKLQQIFRDGVLYNAAFTDTSKTKRVRIAVRDIASNRIGTVDLSLR